MRDIERALRQSASRTGDAGAAAKAAERFAAAAAAGGRADVAYATVDSPFGPMLAASTRRGLVRLAYDWGRRGDELLADLAERVSPRVLESPGQLDPIRRELEEYFEGKRTTFDIAIDWRLSRGFFRQVLKQAKRVRFGELSTYGELAAEAGSPRAGRAAGSALRTNPITIVVPCHRIVRSGGVIGGYGGDVGGYAGWVSVKRALLEHEGSLDEDGRLRLTPPDGRRAPAPRARRAPRTPSRDPRPRATSRRG
jgi:methylated-DNA-[protein]-cysteine S-methyltransferase